MQLKCDRSTKLNLKVRSPSHFTKCGTSGSLDNLKFGSSTTVLKELGEGYVTA
ncbi:MAG TPA: hypothetical protein V6D43_10370 [Candidatus Sericytochromatia bacterium]